MQLTSILETFFQASFGALCHSSYNPESPNRIYFSIGQVVTVIALVLAFTPLIRPITRFRLAMGVFKPITAYVFFIIGIVFVFLAAILPFIPGEALPIIGYPISWEIFAGLLIVFASLGLLWSINRRVRFNSKNCKKYLNYGTSLIARGNESDLRELADEIYDSIEAIVVASKEYDSSEAYFAKKEGKEYKIPEYTHYALSLLNVLSDKDFCRVMVCHVPHTAIELFRQIEKHGLYDSGGYFLINQLICQAFAERSSILYREEDYYGLGHFKTFTNTVFGNYEMVESNFRPLQAWSYWEDDDIQPWKVEKYAKVLTIAEEAYITSGVRHGHPSALYFGFEQLAHITTSQCINLGKLSDDEAYDSLAFRNMREVERGLIDTVKILQEHEKDIPDDKVNEDNYNEFEDFSIYGAVAAGIYKFYENLSMIQRHDEDVRMLAVSLWLDVYPVSKNLESKAIIEIQKRLDIHLFKKIEENLVNLWYPMVTRLLLNLMELNMPNVKTEERGETRIKNRFFRLLQEHYEKAVKQDAKKANDLLPKNIQYDNVRGRLIKTHPSGSVSILELREHEE
jgi:hypothetical protein